MRRVALDGSESYAVLEATGRATPIVEDNGELLFNIRARTPGGKKGDTAATQGDRSDKRFAALAEKDEEGSARQDFSWRDDTF